ncbi:MAG: ABC transporter permease [Myxococcales bacterium]
MWTLLREVSLRHLRHSPLRTGLVVFGIALGVAMLCAVLAVNNSLTMAFEDMVDRVAGKADLTVAGSDAGIPTALTGEIADVKGVAHAAAMLEVVTRTPDGKGGSLLVLGVDFLGDTFFLPFAQEGPNKVIDDPLAFVNDPTAILVSDKLARARNLKMGSELALVTSEGPKTFYVRGLLKSEGPAATFGGQVVVMFVDAAQVSFARGYSVDRIDIVVNKDADLQKVKASIANLIKGRAQVEEPRGRTQRLVASLWAFKNALNMSGIVSLWVGMFLIYNAVSVSVAQRRREVGILRALGVEKGRMVRLFCLEALVMAAIGTGFGLLLAQQLAHYALGSVQSTVNRMYLPSELPSASLSRDIIVGGIIAGFGTTLFASYGPARATSKVDPAEALRSSKSSAMLGKLNTYKLAAFGVLVVLGSLVPMSFGGEGNGYFGCAILMLGLTLLVPLAVKLFRLSGVAIAERVLGIPGRIALDNVERSLGRSSVTVVALMLAVGMSMTVGAYANAFQQSISEWSNDAFPADAWITAGSPLLDRHHVPFSINVMDKLRDVPGIAGLSPVRVTFLDVGGKRAQIASVDSRLHIFEGQRKGRTRRVIDGPSKLDPTQLVSGQRVLISENMARINHLAAGDKIQLDTPTGSREFTVYAVVIDYSSDQGWIMMDHKWYREFWQDEQLDSVDLYFADGVNQETLVSEVRNRLGGGESLFVSLHDAVRAEMKKVAKSIFAYAKAPELITLIVAVMGVIGTMLAAVIDRIREIGMLRAIGATRAQVVASLVAEAGFLGLSAALCGILAGVPQGYIFLKVIGTATSGWNLPYDFPWETAVRMALFVVGAAALAGFLPGRRAAGLDVKEALSYE